MRIGQLLDRVHVAQAPRPQPTDAPPQADGPPALAATNLALCQQPAATVAIAPTTHTITTNKPVSG
jgi:hypothetical protein